MQLHGIVVQRPDVNPTCCSDQDGQGGGVIMRSQQTLTAFRTQHPNLNPAAGTQAAVVVSVHEPDCFPRADTLAAAWLRVHGLQGAVKKNLAARDAAVLASNPKQAAGRRKPPPRGLAAQGASTDAVDPPGPCT